MNPKPITTPKDFFLDLTWLIALYASIISLINILFETINRSFPDVLSYQNYYVGTYDTSIRLSIACLIVFFPVYIFITRYVRKITENDPSKKDIRSHKWFVYLTVFLTSITMLVDLIALINTFLNGEITTRFILKVIAILIVMGVAFGYYMFELRKEGVSNKIGNIFVSISILITVGTLVYAFIIIGSPNQERLRKIDQQKIYDLQNIQYKILDYWQKQSRIPASLNVLNDPIYSFTVPHDPDFRSGKNSSDYVYTVIDSNTFELCATFNIENQEEKSIYDNPYPPEMSHDNNWTHTKGNQCFKRVLDKTKYPPVK
jgi:hypothetical protein